jgi:hypothetical protein
MKNILLFSGIFCVTLLCRFTQICAIYTEKQATAFTNCFITHMNLCKNDIKMKIYNFL